MDRRDFNFKIKTVNADGTFTGIAATYGNVDLGNDRILPGAFARTLSPGKKFPVLWQHEPGSPIASCEITDSRNGLQLTGALELSDPTAKKAYTFMKAGIVKGLSIGYDTIQSSYDGDVRNLTELKLYEVSVVTFPMNEMAGVTSIKALSDEDRAKHLQGIDKHRKLINRSQKAIHEHLKSLFDCGDDEDAALLEDDEGEDEEMTKAFVAEMRKLVEEAKELA